MLDLLIHNATLPDGRINASGTLLEGIALWGELKPQLTPDALIERALAYGDWAVAQGLLAVRSHVDICDPRLLAVEALLEVKRRVAPYLDLQLVAFPKTVCCATPKPWTSYNAHSAWVWTWSAASPTSNARQNRAP